MLGGQIIKVVMQSKAGIFLTAFLVYLYKNVMELLGVLTIDFIAFMC